MDFPFLCASLLAVLSAPQDARPRVETHESWSVGFSGYRRVVPAGDLVVLAQADGVYGNDATTGASRWARQDLDEGFGVPTVGHGRVYVGAAQGADSDVTKKQATHALDLASGESRWTSTFWAYEGVVDLGDRVAGIGTTVSGGKLAVVALRASDGEVAWSTPLDGLWKTAPRPQRAGELVLCRVSTSVVALRAADGAVAWRTSSDERWQDYGVFGDVVVLLGGGEGRSGVARAVAAANGELRWNAKLSAPSTGVAFVGGDALVATWDGEVARLDLAGGADRWRAKLPDGSTESPLVAGDLVLALRKERSATGARHTWCALDLATGSPRGDVLEVHANDTLLADERGRLWWSRPHVGKFCGLDLRRAAAEKSE